MAIALGIIAGLIVLLLVIVALRPAAFRVVRSGLVRAAPDTAFAIINDFGHWSTWSPYEAIDPAMTRTISTPSHGPGATYAWHGNAKAGAGTMTISESAPSSRIAMRLVFTRPFRADNQVRFEVQPEGEGCRVSWIMEGRHGFMGKAMSMICDMDRMIGRDFEQGLANLDTVAHAAADPS
ncbi:MAG: SRPBCC family protein [Planctomycetes bacterium]|nr:SRPBCC family protein [Planctomycetota bacterium]